jgi:tRNA A58 N-methylase Trm61
MPDPTGTVIAVIDDGEQARQALLALASAGYGAGILHGEEGRAILGRRSDEGITGVIRRLVLDLGEGSGVIEVLDDALEQGAYIASVDIESDQVREVVVILGEHGGHDMWRLDEASHSPLIDPETSLI